MSSAATISIASPPYLTAAELSNLLLSAQTSSPSTSSNSATLPPPEKIAIVDVRDDDHIGGHIRHSIHAPSASLDAHLPSLVRRLRDKEVVVFHCALSQQRGPKAALRYVRERERLLGGGKGGEGGKIGLLGIRSGRGGGERGDVKEVVVGRELGGDKVGMKEDAGEVVDKDQDGEWEDIPEQSKPREQKVFVLERGFVGWQEMFGKDERLTEGFREELWKDGYWM